MNCISCDEPANIDGQRFCVRCGHPTAQPSPYLDGSPDSFIPLRDSENRPLVICPQSNGLLKACPQCGRLTRLSERWCVTAGCEGRLVEPAIPFPSPEGSLDGARTAFWAGDFPSDGLTVVAKPPPIDIDAVQYMAFRYGLLICVTGRGVALLRSNGNGWERSAFVALENQLNATSLIVDDGRILLTTSNTTYVMSLIGLNDIVVDDKISEECRVQAKAPGYWVRLIDRRPRTVAVITDFSTGLRHEFDLDIDLNAVTACVAGNRIIIAEQQRLHSVDPITGQDVLLTAPDWKWMRVAMIDDVIVALGSRNEGSRLLYTVTTRDRAGDKRSFDGGGAPFDFVWVADKLYLLTDKVVLTLPIDELTGKLTSTDLQSGLLTMGPSVGIADKSGRGRLLISRKDGPFYRVLVLDPETGKTIDIGHRTEALPVLCVAENKVVVAAREGSTTKIRTFMRPE